MNYKLLLVFGCVGFIFIINPESFVIKKAKQILVAPKDQALEAMGICLEQNPAFLTNLSDLMKQYAQVQQLCMTIVKAEVEGTDHILCHLSDEQLCTVRDALKQIEKQIKLTEKSMQALQVACNSMCNNIQKTSGTTVRLAK